MSFCGKRAYSPCIRKEEAEEETLKMLEGIVISWKLDAMPVIKGKKTKKKFRIAARTFTVEALMSDGRALQAGTSHSLGQHFAKVFDITYLDKDGELKHVWQTSWGVSTRLVGAIIMTHGDDRGLRLPPNVAPIQVAMVPISRHDNKATVMEKSNEIYNILKETFRVKLDDRDEYTPGWKFNEWEMKGVPIRLELGPRDIEKNQAVLVRRDTGEKKFVKIEDLKKCTKDLLDEIQENMFKQAQEFVQKYRNAKTIKELNDIIENQRGL